LTITKSATHAATVGLRSDAAPVRARPPLFWSEVQEALVVVFGKELLLRSDPGPRDETVLCVLHGD
jgi:hypothetical protein